MRGSIDGTEIYLSEDQLPAVTLSVNSLTDPSKVTGARSTTIRVIATKEARRVLGGEGMAEVPRTDRPVLRIGEDSVDLFRSDVIPVRHTRNEIECVGAGGNASWFEHAKGRKLRALDMGVSAPLSSDMQMATWNDLDTALFFPLIDFGSLSGRSASYDVPITALRPSIRVHKIMDAAFNEAGYSIEPMGTLKDGWENLLLLDPKAKFVVTIPSPYPVYEIFETSNPAPDGYFFIPSADGTMDVECYQLEINLNPADTQFDAMRFRVVVYDYTARERIAEQAIPLVYFGDPSYGGMRVDHTFVDVPVLAGHQIYVSIECLDIEEPVPVVIPTDASHVRYNLNAGAQVLKLRPGNNPNLYALLPIHGWAAYYPGYQIEVAKVAPDWTVSDLVGMLTNALCLVFDTDTSTRTVRIWHDNEYFRRPLPDAPHRDWTARLDHSTPPAKIADEPPRRIVMKYENDGKDVFVRMADRRSGAEFGYGSYIQDNPSGISGDTVVSVRVSPTINGVILEGCLAPIMRDVSAEHQEDSFDRSIRLLVHDGVEDGAWKFDGVTRSEYPRTYFSDANTPIPLAFGNATFDDVVHPLTKDGAWKRRLDVMRSSRILEAKFLIRDHELKDFDFGMPTLVDDGSGPAWYWVQEIQQHRFGKGIPTKCILVEIPGKEVALKPYVAPPPFVCAGPGYGAITFSEGGEVTLSVSGASGYAVRLPDSSIVTQTNGEAQEAAGACCLWSANGEEIGGAVVAALVIGASSMNLSGLQSLEALVCAMCTMDTIDLTSQSSLVSVQNDSEALTHVALPISSALNSVSFVNAALSEVGVNDILANLRANSFSGWCDLSGGSSAAPTGQGIADKAWLIGNGATIYTN